MSENVYADTAEEIAAGGIEALHEYLLNLDLGDFNEHTKPPMTKSKQDLIDINLESGERFISEWLSGDIDIPVIPALSEDFYRCYLQWCKRNGVMRPRELNQLIGYVAKIRGWSKDRKRVYTNTHYRGDLVQRTVINPPVAYILESNRLPIGKKESEWLTDCIFDFKNALSGGEDD